MYPGWHCLHLGPTNSSPVQSRSCSCPSGQYNGFLNPVQLVHMVGAVWLHFTMYWYAWHCVLSWHYLHSKECKYSVSKGSVPNPPHTLSAGVRQVHLVWSGLITAMEGQLQQL